MLTASRSANVHEVCYHGSLVGNHRELGGYQVWECDHHHGKDDSAAIACARTELERRREAYRVSRPHKYRFAPGNDAGPTDYSCGDCSLPEADPIHKAG
jgi:hypothetical protein